MNRRTVRVGIESSANREVHELACYVAGLAAGRDDEKLERAAEWLERLSEEVCAQGYIGCSGGETCESDHK